MTNITKQRQKQASVKPKQKEEEKPSVVTWDDVAGLAQAKQALYESAVLPAKRPDLFRGSGLRKPPRGILLYGPPGTGKTMLAKALAAEADLHFAAVSASTVLSKWVGESEKNIRDMFVAARECQPAVLFIDEIDSLLASRTEGEQDSVRRMKNEFLIQLDGVTSLKDDDRVLIVAATNRPFDLDEAALRRFPKRIYIPLPDEDARNALIRHLLKKESHSLKEADIQWLVRITAGFSCADITSMAREAAMVAVHEISRESMEHAQLRPIARSDFEVALQRIKPTVSKALLDKFEKWTRDFGMSGT
jgi:spastin